MDTLDTIFLAQLLGVFTLVLGLSMLVKQKMLMNIYEDFFKNRTLVYFIGAIEMVTGVLMVLRHNIWEGELATAVTILGWFLLLEGLVYMFASRGVLKGFANFLHQKPAFNVIAIGVTVLEHV